MATYKHLRSSTANKRPTTAIADGQLALNTNSASPGLFFKDSAGTGIVKIGPVHVGATAPNSTPAAGGSSGNYTGEQWLDTSVSPAQLKVWNGSAWVGVVADELPVSKLQDGAAGQIVQTDSAGTGVEWSSTANLPLGSASAPAYRFQGDPNTGIYSPGADQVAISTNGTGRLFINSAGRVSVNAAADRFDVTTTGSLGALFTTGANGYIRVTDGTIQTNIQNTGGAGNLTTVTEHPLVLRTFNTERARIDSSGRLLVGTSSARAWQAGALTPAVQVEAASANGSCISALRTDASSSGARLLLGQLNGAALVSNNYTPGDISFQAYDGSQLLRTASIASQVDGTPGANDMPGRLVFSVTADGASSPTERMRITSAGNVLVGKTATDDTVVGFTARPDGFISSVRSSNPLAVFNRLGSDGSVILFRKESSDVGSISVTTTATAYNTSSDYRLKENVVPLTGAADRLNQLQVHRFNFIADPSKTVDGFLAHEAQAVVPECVTGEKDAVDADGNPVYQGIDQSKLVPLLTAALQEALAEIESLKARVTALEP